MSLHQQSLFDGGDLTTPIVARARRDDPETSHIAAEQHERSGVANTNRNIVLRLVTDNPWSTYRELAECCDLTCNEVMRRLNDLEKSGLIEKGPARNSRVGRGKMLTWNVK